MSKAFYLLAFGAGVAAIYFYDEKKGKKRRAQLRKTLDQGLKYADEYTREWRKKAPDIARAWGERVQEYAAVAGSKAGEYSKEYAPKVGSYLKDAGLKANEMAAQSKNGWKPSARFIGAMASALAFYGVARRGFFGTVLRTLSLGLFTRALMAAR